MYGFKKKEWRTQFTKWIEAGYIKARATRLKGAQYTFDAPSVTATENLLMAAALAEGVTTLDNCALEPEIPDLAQLLCAMGAKIEGAGTSTISIEGVSSLHGTSHRVPPDRIETGTFLTAAAATRGDITVLDTAPDFLHHVLGKLERLLVELRGLPDLLLLLRFLSLAIGRV